MNRDKKRVYLGYAERFAPYAVASLAASVYFLLLREIPGKFEDVLPLILSVSAVGIGFLATCLTIVLSMADAPVIKFFRDAGKLVLLVDYFIEAIVMSFVLSVVSGLLILVDFDDLPGWINFAAGLWLWLTAAATLATVRVLLFFGFTLRESCKD